MREDIFRKTNQDNLNENAQAVSSNCIAYSQKSMEVLFKWRNPDIVTPSLLIVQPQNEGVGCCEYVKALAKAYYLQSDPRRSFEKTFLSLRYPKDISEEGIKRFFDSPRIVAEHYNRFLGVFAIEITEYLYHSESSAFVKLLEYVTSNRDEINFVFLISTDDKTAAQRMYAVINKHIRIEQLTMEYADTKSYVSYAINLLCRNQLKYEKGVEEVLSGYIQELAQRDSFCGYDTIIRLTDDIIYEMQCCDVLKVRKGDVEKIKDLHLKENLALNSRNNIGF